MTVTKWSGPVPDQNEFNPHGADINEYGFIASDFIIPSSLFSSPSFQHTAHHFNLDGSYNGTIALPESGFMDYHFFPHKGFRNYGVICSSLNNVVYRINYPID
jgi:hypothetical protein